MLWKIALSALLSMLAYPKFNLSFLAWIAFVPLFFALESKGLKARFIAGYFFGVLFFSGILYWLVGVSVPGAIVLVLLLALAPAIFSSLYLYGSAITNRRTPSGLGALSILSVPSAWVFTEYIRSHLFTGFPWALLGNSQSYNLPLIQIADITGVYGVSFLIILVNFALYLAFRKTPGRFYILFLVLIIFALVLTYGQNRIKKTPPRQVLKVAVLQGNIPQSRKWDPRYRDHIINKYKTLTEESLRQDPELVIWPETALPGYLEEEDDLKDGITALARRNGVHLLVGTLKEENSKVFNSATLISDKGKILEHYGKIRLVPFGEFVPFEEVFSWLRAFIDKPIGDFDKGYRYVVFKFKLEKTIREAGKIYKSTEFHEFSSLVCYEDIFPAISRRFVGKGAKFLVNITNDAWFGKTAAPYQHMQSSVFRAVENRVPVIRAANTGFSCIIDQSGRILKVVESGGGEIFVDGYAAGLIEPSYLKTAYTRLGDLFSFACIALVFVSVIIGRRRKMHG